MAEKAENPSKFEKAGTFGELFAEYGATKYSKVLIGNSGKPYINLYGAKGFLDVVMCGKSFNKANSKKAFALWEFLDLPIYEWEGTNSKTGKAFTGMSIGVEGQEPEDLVTIEEMLAAKAAAIANAKKLANA